MKPNLRLLLPACLLAGCASLTSAQGSILYGSSPFENKFFQINPANGQLINIQPVSLAGSGITGITALTANPVDNTLWGVVKTGSGRALVTIDPNTATASLVGGFGNRNFSSLAYNSAGVLYGTTGNGDPVSPETLYRINPANAALTLEMVLGNGADGEVIAFGPGDTLYHSSGNGTAVFESIDLGAQTTTFLGNESGEMFGMGYDVDAGLMYGSDINSRFFTINLATGARTLIGVNAEFIDIRGIAVLEGDASLVPEPGTWAVGGLTLGGLVFGAWRRVRSRDASSVRAECRSSGEGA